MKKSGHSIFLLSPPAIVFFVWVLTTGGAYIGYSFADQMPILSQAMRNYGVDFNYPLAGIVWVILCMIVFLVFSVPMLQAVPAFGPEPGSSHNLSKAIRVAALVMIAFSVVILLWLTTSAAQLGGFGSLFNMLQSFEGLEARDALLENKLFVGMRLLYTAFFSLSTFGVCVIAHNIRTGDRIRSDMMIAGAITAAAILLLILLAVVLLIRIIALQTIIAAFVASSMIMGRIVGLKYFPLGLIVLFSIWSSKEALTVGQWDLDASPFQVGFERLIFYLVNDFGNSVWPFSFDTPHTYGLFSFKFVVFFSLQETYVFHLLRDELDVLNTVRGGGEFPIFTAPYVDFSYFGIIFIIFIAMLFTYIFNRAHRNFTFAWLYGMIGAGLFISTHVPYYSAHDFIFNVMIALFISCFIRTRPQNGLRTAPA